MPGEAKIAPAVHGPKAWLPVHITKCTAPCFIASQRKVDYYSRFGFFKLRSKSFKSILMAA